MALAIDTSEVTRDVELINSFFQRWGIHDTSGRPCHIYRACIVGTVIHDDSFFSRSRRSDGPVVRREALDWRPDPDDELDEVEVLHHLHKQAKSSPLLESALSHTNRSTATSTVMASCALPPSSLPASVQGRPLSDFRRNSIRFSGLVRPNPHGKDGRSISISTGDYVSHRHSRYGTFLHQIYFLFSPRLVDRSDACVAWQMQLDLVDFTTRRRHPTGYPQRGRRSIINPFHRVSAPRIQEDPPSNPRKDSKQIRGVRYRQDHKRWTAEMKPPKHKNKVYFGEFESQSQAARVVDVAFHYYGKLPLNFSYTRHILEGRPIPANMSDEDKLNFVKEQAKWVSSTYFDLPSPPLSNGEDDGEGDDGSCPPQLSPHPEARAGLGNNGCGEGSVGIGGFGGGASTSILEAQQGLPEWRPSYLPSYTPTSSMCIIDGEDGAEHSTAPTSTKLSSPWEPSCYSYVQPDDEEVMSERGNAKRLRFTISTHQFSPPSDQVDAAAESPLRAFAAATSVFPATFSQCPSDGDADRGDNGMWESQPWSPLADSMEPDGVLADGVDGGAVRGTLQEQQDLSVRHVENLLCSSLSSPSSFLDITERTHSVDVAPTNYGSPLQFSFENQEMPVGFLMMSPAPSPTSHFDSLPNYAQCLWEQQSLNLTGSQADPKTNC